jgi:aryl-alcohol dehydrogenase-like predicted oxidoreductase
MAAIIFVCLWTANSGQSPVASVIAGATRPEQLEQNVKAGNWALTSEELREIDRITMSGEE